MSADTDVIYVFRLLKRSCWSSLPGISFMK